MALFIVRLQWQKRTGRSTELAVRTYVESYLVQTNNLLTDEVAVLLAPGIPRIGTIYVGADGVLDTRVATAREVTANNREDSPYFWDVIVNYSNRTEDPAKHTPDPVQRRPSVSWTNQLQTIVSPSDLNGDAIVNSAGEKFSDPPEENEIIQVYHVSRTEDFDPNPALGATFVDSVNQHTFMGIYPPGYAKCTKLDSKERFENNRYYYDTDYDISCRSPLKPYGWQPYILDQGMHTKDPITGKPRAIFDDKTGQPIQSPVLLDGNGQLLANAEASLQQGLNAVTTQGVFNTPIPKWLLNATLPLNLFIGSEPVVILTVGTDDPLGFDGAFTLQRDPSGGQVHPAGTTIPAPAFYITFITHPEVDFGLLNLTRGL